MAHISGETSESGEHEDLDLLCDAAIADPHRYLAAFRDRAPVVWSSRHRAWVVLGHPELDAATFRSWADYPDEALGRSGVDPLAAADDVDAAEGDLISAWRPVTRAWGDLVWAHLRDS